MNQEDWMDKEEVEALRCSDCGEEICEPNSNCSEESRRLRHTRHMAFLLDRMQLGKPLKRSPECEAQIDRILAASDAREEYLATLSPKERKKEEEAQAERDVQAGVAFIMDTRFGGK